MTAPASDLSTRPAAFLDRDGVINVDSHYPHLPEHIEWISGAPQAIARLNAAGYFVFVVTNQAGVARGLYDEASVLRLHDWMAAELSGAGALVDAWYYCPHHPSEGAPPYRLDCDCRKPKPGMLQQALNSFPVDLGASFLVGDRVTDIAAAEAAGIPGFLFSGGALDAFVGDCLSRIAPRR